MINLQILILRVCFWKNLKTCYPMSKGEVFYAPHSRLMHCRSHLYFVLHGILHICCVDCNVKGIARCSPFLGLHNLCATLKCTSPSTIIFHSTMDMINASYRIYGTHVNPIGLKSDAPMDVIWYKWLTNHQFSQHILIILKFK